MTLNDRVRDRRRWRGDLGEWYPDDPIDSPRFGFTYWNVQADDAEAFGTTTHIPLGGGPLRLTRWADGRTTWDELHVLRFAFGSTPIGEE